MLPASLPEVLQKYWFSSITPALCIRISIILWMKWDILLLFKFHLLMTRKLDILVFLIFKIFKFPSKQLFCLLSKAFTSLFIMDKIKVTVMGQVKHRYSAGPSKRRKYVYVISDLANKTEQWNALCPMGWLFVPAQQLVSLSLWSRVSSVV